MVNGVHTFWIMLTSVLDYISFIWVDHILLVVGSYIVCGLLYRCGGLLYRFYPRPVLAFGYCRCLRLSVSVRPSVRVCGNHVLVRAMTHHQFKLGSTNLDPRCKRPWLRSLLFCGTIDCDLQGQIELQSQNLPHFEFVHAITHHQFKLQFPNLEQKCILALFRSLPILGLIEIGLQFNF